MDAADVAVADAAAAVEDMVDIMEALDGQQADTTEDTMEWAVMNCQMKNSKHFAMKAHAQVAHAQDAAVNMMTVTNSADAECHAEWVHSDANNHAVDANKDAEDTEWEETSDTHQQWDANNQYIAVKHHAYTEAKIVHMEEKFVDMQMTNAQMYMVQVHVEHVTTKEQFADMQVEQKYMQMHARRQEHVHSQRNAQMNTWFVAQMKDVQQAQIVMNKDMLMHAAKTDALQDNVHAVMQVHATWMQQEWNAVMQVLQVQ